ncbi:hypothetical protein NTGBS_280012 [Candidatus Nitrotoga sp. BS]|uniref:hypothetical protein n=1 Tax=Candidatus Nitrotoga sp. BS TaxID=2890408 RepID=UPI001EF30EB3|nr:hypothetical protein [Candidatus Nitrotoga sp. BS]CAH1197932.1 hypothetical protein NTGBS_280012 [Candidatus Nitrotoga sp. BS]
MIAIQMALAGAMGASSYSNSYVRVGLAVFMNNEKILSLYNYQDPTGNCDIAKFIDCVLFYKA